MKLRTVVASWALATVACAGLHAPVESAPPSEPGHAMHDTIQLLQGMTIDHGGSRLAFQGGDGRGGAKVDVWDAQDSAWLSHWVLAPGQVLAAGSGFLRVEAVEPGARATLHLAPANDSGGIVAPAPGQPVVPLGGSLDIGQTRIELIEISDDGAVTARLWPKLYPLAKTAPEDIREMRLAPGDEVQVGRRAFRVDRVQRDAGELRGFVALTPES